MDLSIVAVSHDKRIKFGKTFEQRDLMCHYNLCHQSIRGLRKDKIINYICIEIYESHSIVVLQKKAFPISLLHIKFNQLDLGNPANEEPRNSRPITSRWNTDLFPQKWVLARRGDSAPKCFLSPLTMNGTGAISLEEEDGPRWVYMPLAIIPVWTFVTNAVVLVAFIRDRSLRNNLANVIIASLTMADFFLSILVLPLAVYYKVRSA